MSPKKHPLASVIPIRLLLIIACLMISAGCESLRYYGQAIHGQVDILARRRPINQLLIEPDTPETLKMKLRHVLDIREFAKNELHLPVADHYLSFVALERPY
ncbi:MAG: aminopeptidase, partial [Gammaproteobacteria bacterium]